MRILNLIKRNIYTLKTVGIKRYVNVKFDHAKENFNIIFGRDGYQSYFSKEKRMLRRAKKMGKRVCFFTGKIVD